MSEHSEILERFRRGAELLAMATTGAAGSELDFAAADNPTLPAFDQNAWAEKLDYSRRKISVALEQFRMMRSENFELIKELPDAAFARSGTHTKRGAMTLLEMVTLAAEHVEKHVSQIRTTRASFKEPKAQQKAAS